MRCIGGPCDGMEVTGPRRRERRFNTRYHATLERTVQVAIYHLEGDHYHFDRTEFIPAKIRPPKKPRAAWNKRREAEDD